MPDRKRNIALTKRSSSTDGNVNRLSTFLPSILFDSSKNHDEGAEISKDSQFHREHDEHSVLLVPPQLGVNLLLGLRPRVNEASPFAPSHGRTAALSDRID